MRPSREGWSGSEKRMIVLRVGSLSGATHASCSHATFFVSSIPYGVSKKRDATVDDGQLSRRMVVSGAAS